jgi:glycosyltransferase involved in cell wall biosynthesis
MRKLYFLLPGTGKRFACGGLWVELKTVELAKRICSATVVTYRQKEKDTLFLDELLQQSTDLNEAIFVVSWGFDVAKLAVKLRSYNVVYHAHSSGYGFQLPANIPIIAVSRNTMGYWGQSAPNSLIYYLPNQINDEFTNLHDDRSKQGSFSDRDIDILVQKRKSSEYLIQQLVPELQKKCNVVVVDSYVEDLAVLFNRTKIYLYDSAEYWAQQRVSEGFGMQPMEALACGCKVFSSINGGLSDYLDPVFNCYKIAGYALEYDLQRILQAVRSEPNIYLTESFFAEYRRDNILQRLEIILQDINLFFDYKSHCHTKIPILTKMRLIKLFLRKIFEKIKQIVGS